MPDAPLVAHSLTEARLFLMVTPCSSCSQGPLRFSQLRVIGEDPAHRAEAQDQGGGFSAAIDTTCAGCEAVVSFTFRLPGSAEQTMRETGADDTPVGNRCHTPGAVTPCGAGGEVPSKQGEKLPHDAGTVEINATDEPSRIIDVAHWLTLFRMGAEEAGRESNKIQARELWIEVGQYLAEALKFYDDPDSDLPPQEALFSDDSRARLRENPQQFSRQRLINVRAKLPSPWGHPGGSERG